MLQAQAPAFRADLEAGHYLKVLAEAEQALREHPNEALAWASKSQALSSLLRFPEALAAAERAVSLKPDLADALLARGLARAGEAIRQRDFGALRSALGAMDDLRAANVDFLTIGQYLQPTRKHARLDRFWSPEEFASLESIARAKGFLMVSASPLTRSSYHADSDFAELKAARAAKAPGAIA